MSEERDYNEELEAIFGKSTDLRVAYKDSGMYPSQIILDRNMFLRRIVKVCVAGIGLALACLMVLSFGLNKAANKDPISLAFLLSPENSVVELQQTSLPSITEKDVLKFASDKVKEFHKISFTDYIEYITSLEDEFTNQRAFDNYQLQMMNSKLIDQITSRKLTSWSEPTSAPRIVDFDEDNYIWHIQMTVDWFMGGGNYSTNGREYQIDLIIHSVSRDKNIRGLAVDSYFLKSVRG